MIRSSADVRIAVKLKVMVRGFSFLMSYLDHFHQGCESFLLDFSRKGFLLVRQFSTFEVGPHYLFFPPTSLRMSLLSQSAKEWLNGSVDSHIVRRIVSFFERLRTVRTFDDTSLGIGVAYTVGSGISLNGPRDTR